ncbi:DoxX family protein [Streptomyces sp. Ru87]|uniref:DoxX family protein n=1 Tax=Streptomyces sp. Ru87 TaxID=2044307 RepID=UPI000BF7D1FB|nr:DoxX family protein [Streptomyces sp. Ru87]PGH49129.1 hypothetical protein CRI70_19395 [Streptomyces sp. Ru87]
MSVDTRTPRPSGGSSPGFDDGPAWSTVKVPCDPAQVVVNHASFRVQLAAPGGARRAGVRPPRFTRVTTAAVPASASASPAPAAAAASGGRRRAPVVWSGHTQPGDPAAGSLLQAVRANGGHVPYPPDEAAGTQLLPRFPADETRPTVVGQRGPVPEGALLGGIRPARGAYDDDPGEPTQPTPIVGHGRDGDEDTGEFDPFGHLFAAGNSAGAARAEDGEQRARRQGNDAVRHAYYPGRRMNLGVVLLPLRVFLGFISVYAGMGKLCDPVYFDGTARGSMVTWLRSLEPWGAAAPLHDFALTHPVGSGLTVAFLQIVVGVLTVCGLWQRLAASIGALLSAALLMTVSWRSMAVYDTPDIIYLAAWSPLIIAGAPVYSLDGRLASEAWRRLGPRVSIGDLRRRVLRRGLVMATVVVGLALITGAVLGGAVRSSGTTAVPGGPSDMPRNNLPGSPLPTRSGAAAGTDGGGRASAGPGDGSRSADPSSSASDSEGAASRGPEGAAQQPTQGATAGQAPPQQTAPPEPPPSRTAGPTSTGGSGDSTGGGSSSGGGGSGGSGGSDGGGSSSGGALGGLLG